ncbi:MAG: helix-turn-helix domain-containing protein [Archaeoglobaceae archaeon]
MKGLDDVDETLTRSMDTKELILHVLHQRGSILQKDLRKELNMGSGSCSRVLRRLEKDELIKRVQVVADGSSTFKILLIDSDVEEEEPSLESIMGSIRYSLGISPCFGCPEEECTPSKCVKLELWFLEEHPKEQEIEAELIMG